MSCCSFNLAKFVFHYFLSVIGRQRVLHDPWESVSRALGETIPRKVMQNKNRGKWQRKHDAERSAGNGSIFFSTHRNYEVSHPMVDEPLHRSPANTVGPPGKRSTLMKPSNPPRSSLGGCTFDLFMPSPPPFLFRRHLVETHSYNSERTRFGVDWGCLRRRGRYR